MTELATQRADQDGRDVQSELEQLTDELQKEQLELKRIKTIARLEVLRLLTQALVHIMYSPLTSAHHNQHVTSQSQQGELTPPSPVCLQLLSHIGLTLNPGSPFFFFPMLHTRKEPGNGTFTA